LITLKNVTLRRGAKVLLDGATVTINPGEKVGLVGRNGAGKSSLFALFNGNLHEDGGEYYIPTQWRMGQVAQDMPETDQSATDFVVEGDTTLLAAQQEVAASEATDDYDRMAHAYMALQDAGAHDAPARAQALIQGLGFKTTELDNPVNSFSGGWRMRLQLARALMCPSDLLLLDEPTNHLDLATREALAMALNEFEGTVMLVSHDRALLRAVCDEFWLVSRGGIEPFDGDLDDYQRYLLDMAKQSREAQRQEQKDLQRGNAAAPAVVAVAAPAPAANRSSEQRKQDSQRRQQLTEQLRPLKKELEHNEKRTATLSQQKNELETRLSQPASPKDMADAGRELKAVNDEIEALELRWLELTEQIEGASANG
jgi:ATP-binding cassette subfamily F protein 3